jgi:hypothetical protein
MRRLIAAAIIAVLVITVSFVGIGIINSVTKEVEKRIEKIQDTAFEDTGKKAEEFFYFWEQKREIMAVFVNHEKIDEIGTLAARMVSAERGESAIDLFESANEILFIIRGLKEDEQFSLYTLL